MENERRKPRPQVPIENRGSSMIIIGYTPAVLKSLNTIKKVEENMN